MDVALLGLAHKGVLHHGILDEQGLARSQRWHVDQGSSLSQQGSSLLLPFLTTCMLLVGLYLNLPVFTMCIGRKFVVICL